MTYYMDDKANAGSVVWLTGLSGAGKTTIARSLNVALANHGVHSVVLDGDDVRGGLNADLGFSPEDRHENIRRIAQVAKLISTNRFVVIAATISPRRDDRSLAQKIIGDKFIEVFVDTPIEVCETRDVKGLYKLARRGAVPNFTGVSDTYEPSISPALILKPAEMSLNTEIELLIRLLRANGADASGNFNAK